MSDFPDSFDDDPSAAAQTLIGWLSENAPETLAALREALADEGPAAEDRGVGGAGVWSTTAKNARRSIAHDAALRGFARRWPEVARISTTTGVRR